MNIHEKGAKFLADTQRKHAARYVEYVRTAASVRVPATLGRTQWNVDDGAGATIRTETRDYMISASDLIIDGMPVEPRSGDRIHEGDFVYEVSAPGPGLAHWSWDSEFRHRYRIHTKYVTDTP